MIQVLKALVPFQNKGAPWLCSLGAWCTGTSLISRKTMVIIYPLMNSQLGRDAGDAFPPQLLFLQVPSPLEFQNRGQTLFILIFRDDIQKWNSFFFRDVLVSSIPTILKIIMCICQLYWSGYWPNNCLQSGYYADVRHVSDALAYP